MSYVPFFRVHVERVYRSRVIVVQPGGEKPETAQLAAVLVRNDVVRVIGTGTVVAKMTERMSGDVLAGDDS